MTYFTVTNLDYITIKMEGMACVMKDYGNEETALELSRMAKELKNISKDIMADAHLSPN